MSGPSFNPLTAGSGGGPAPLPTDPGQLAQMMGGGAPQGPMPQTSPVQSQPNGGMTPDILQLMSTMAQKYQEPAMQNLGNVAGQMGQVAQSQGQEQIPKFGPGIDHGAGFLHNLGQVLLMVGGLTGPGAALNREIYGPNVEKYEAGQQQKARKLEALKAEAGASGEEASSASQAISGLGMTSYRQGQLGLGAQRNDIAQQKVTAYSQGIQNRLTTALKGLDLKALQTGSQMELNKARTALAQVMPGILQQKNDLEQYGIDTRSETQQTVANTLSQLGIDKTHPVAQMLDSMFGTDMTPTAPQTPGGAQPVAGPKKLPAKGTAVAKKVGQAITHVFVPGQGLQPAGK